MKIYNFNDRTKVFVSESIAQDDPLEIGKYLLPANATFLPPPKTAKNEVAVFNGKKWEIKHDYRGIYFDKNTGKIIEIKDIGKYRPDNTIQNAPPKEFVKPKYVDNQWIETALKFKNKVVQNSEDVKQITSRLISRLGEDKAKTEKIIAGNNPCPIWDEFLKKRNELLKECQDFIAQHNLI